jgi:tRNA(fMet)-specific endonuclease VapC
MKRAVQYLLDTDTCIYLLNGDPALKARVAQAGVAAIAVGIPTAGELYFGAYNSSKVEANLRRVRAFLSAPGPAVLPLDEPAVDCFGRFKAHLRRAGKPIGDLDLLLAGIALSRGLKVVTNNTAHFERIPGISIRELVAHAERIGGRTAEMNAEGTPAGLPPAQTPRTQTGNGSRLRAGGRVLAAKRQIPRQVA